MGIVMTRRDYEMIARAIRREMEDSPACRGALMRLSGRLSITLAGTNPRFNERRFLDACRS